MKLIKETILELKKVTFPSKKKLFKDTSVVIGVCAISTAFVFLTDTMLNLLLTLILK